MFKKPNCPVIAIEEHYWDAELSKTYTGVESGRPGPQSERLFDLGALRIKEMDEAGIDVQVISHGAPSAQKLTGDGAVALVRGVNDRLAAACAANPKRFFGFAALPTADPKAAADELERCVTRHGFKGAMLHGLANNVFLDDEIWPIYERAEKQAMRSFPSCTARGSDGSLHNDYAKEFPMVVRAAWGYTVRRDAIRMVLSGVFDARSSKSLSVTRRATFRWGVIRISGRYGGRSAATSVQHLDHQRKLQAALMRAGDGRRSHSDARSTGRLSPSSRRRVDEGRTALCDEDRRRCWRQRQRLLRI